MLSLISCKHYYFSTFFHLFFLSIPNLSIDMFFGVFLFFKVHTQSLSQVSPSLSPLIVHLFFNLSFGSLHLSYALCVCPSVCQSLFVILLLFFYPFLFQTVSFYPSLKFFSMSNDLHLMSSTSTLRNKSPSLSYIYLV